MQLSEILKDTDYKQSQFRTFQIEEFEKRIKVKTDRNGKDIPYIQCLVRKKEIRLTPEEAVRQLYLETLLDYYGYPADRIELEYPVTFGREKKRADIVIFDKDQTTTPYIIVELKKPKLKEGKEQLKSYCNATGAPIGVWTNGEQISFYHRRDPNYFEDIPNIPKAKEKLSDILSERWTIKQLIEKDKLVNEKKSLKDLILEMEDEVLANAGVDVFEELFKLIFTKLYDEMLSGRDKTRYLAFRNYGDTETELKNKIQALFDSAKQKWEGVFGDGVKIMLTPSHLSVCVASLQDVKLFNSNLEIVDEAFEYLINKRSKGEKGQYFTPRYVIDMCVRMLNPQPHETMIDTAAGSCGFPVHTIFYVWEQILKNKGLNKSHLFTLENKPQECTDYVNNKVFAIDFDGDAVRVARTLNLIAGDGQTNVMHLNTLDYERWYEKTGDDRNPGDGNWIDTYNNGWKKLRKLRIEKDSNRSFEFDILMANPPFAGDIKESRILAKYELGKNAAGKYQTKVGRDVLFIERNLDFLRPGGRMAIVLPQGRFNNTSDKYIREFIAERCRILAVVGLHGNVFKPHTGTKTSVLFVQKWDDALCPKVDDYPIFFATMQEPGKDNSGDKIYLRKRDLAKYKLAPQYSQTEIKMVCEPTVEYVAHPKGLDDYALDEHGHLIVKHDLFNHDGLTQDGIAEAFAEFAKKERLSFFLNSPFNEQRYKCLLEGLEINEGMYSELKEGILGSEFNGIRKRQALQKIKSTHKLIDYFDFHSDIVQDVENVLSYDLTHTLGNFLHDISISKQIDGTRKLAKHGDFIISRLRSYLKEFAVVQSKKEKQVFSTEYLVYRPKTDKISSNTLLAFCLTEEVQTILNCSQYGTEHPRFYEFVFNELPLPDTLFILNNRINALCDDAYKKRKQSQSLYHQAEELLEEAVFGNDDCRDGARAVSMETPNVNIKSLSASFLSTGRLDAEYYQPKYEEIENLVKGLRNGYGLLKDVCNLKDENYIPKESIAYQYIELADIGKSGNITGCTLSDGKELPSRARRKVNFGDVIISSIEGSLESCALVTDDYNNALCSTGFYVINSQAINSETLLVLFKSKPMQHLLKQNCSGTILTAINKSEFQNIPVPLIHKDIQTKIAALIHESFALRRESERLLNEAKDMVEREIEKQ